MGLIKNLLAKVFSAEPTSVSRSAAYREGNDAYYAGSSEASNPHEFGTEKWRQWIAGYVGK